ncbi:complement C1q-like protein 2 [Megalobrama amblycephala]|uniref:complement C1q-like protein 2 n=1 Tax=Megalobrama amblycephala TaxID=75352 RepID=UPI00201404C4|nr:complement C1q-like protein 2 [Megalobrama amblycephala]
MKSLICTLLLLGFSSVFSIQQQEDENEVSQQLSSEDGRPKLASTDSQQNCHLCFPDIHAALRELTAMITEQKANDRAFETRLREAEQAAEQQMFLLEELNKKNDALSNLTQSQVEELRKDNRDKEIAFSAALMQSSSGNIGPFTTDITLTYRNVFTNIGNAYNPITGIFTAPLKGVYMFHISLYGPASQSTPSTIGIIKNGQLVVMAHAHQAQNVVNSSKGVVLLMEVGDVVYVRLFSNRRISDNQNNHNTFSGYLLFPLRE